MAEPNADFEAILHAVAGAGVDFIVVGGVCAVLQGAPVSTFDLDLVFSRDPANLARLEKALRSMSAFYREKPRVSPSAGLLDSAGHHLLMTTFGPLDLLGSTIGGGYPELLGNTETVELEGGVRVLILDLETLIRIKEQLSSDRDRAVLPILRRTLEERRGGKGG